MLGNEKGDRDTTQNEGKVKRRELQYFVRMTSKLSMSSLQEKKVVL